MKHSILALSLGLALASSAVHAATSTETPGTAPASGDELQQNGARNKQPILKIGVVAAHMQPAVGILHHARCLQQHLVDRGGRAQGQLGDGLLVDHVLAAAGIRRERIARDIKRRRHRDGAQLAAKPGRRHAED